MGNIFKLIANAALIPEDAEYFKECHVCGKKGVPLYSYQGHLVDEPDEDVYAVCKDCILDGKVEYIDDSDTDKTINQFCTEPEVEKELLRKTPRIPLFLQYNDWPIHCGELCEFTGVPKTKEESIDIGKTYTMWDKGETTFQEMYGDETLQPSTLNEVSTFMCRKCGKKLFTWQMT
jgi:uncharacterized protein CbrC (UPF0167 family)